MVAGLSTVARMLLSEAGTLFPRPAKARTAVPQIAVKHARKPRFIGLVSSLLPCPIPRRRQPRFRVPWASPIRRYRPEPEPAEFAGGQCPPVASRCHRPAGLH